MLTGVILAGGRQHYIGSRRIELLPLAGESMLTCQIAEMSRLCSEIIIVTDEPRRYLEHVSRSTRILADYYSCRGPLGGLHAALSLASNQTVWVTGTRMPYVSASLAHALYEYMMESGYRAAMPEKEGLPRPLHSLFHKDCLGPLENLLKEQTEGRLEWEMLLGELHKQELMAPGLAAEEFGTLYTERIGQVRQYWEASQLRQVSGQPAPLLGQSGLPLARPLTSDHETKKDTAKVIDSFGLGPL